MFHEIQRIRMRLWRASFLTLDKRSWVCAKGTTINMTLCDAQSTRPWWCCTICTTQQLLHLWWAVIFVTRILRQAMAGAVRLVPTLTFATTARTQRNTHISLRHSMIVLLKTRKLVNSGFFRSISLCFTFGGYLWREVISLHFSSSHFCITWRPLCLQTNEFLDTIAITPLWSLCGLPGGLYSCGKCWSYLYTHHSVG
jgi:hypothetical protein